MKSLKLTGLIWNGLCQQVNFDCQHPTKMHTEIANAKHVLVYVIVGLTVAFGINSASHAGREIVIVQGVAEHYYNFCICIVSTINSKYYSKPYCFRLIQ